MENSDVFLIEYLLLRDLIGDVQRLKPATDEQFDHLRHLHQLILFLHVDHHRSSGEAFWQLSDVDRMSPTDLVLFSPEIFGWQRTDRTEGKQILCEKKISTKKNIRKKSN